MKILLVSLYFYPDKTGVPKYSGEMAQWLAAQGHEVHVIAGTPHYPSWRREAGYSRWRFQAEQWQGVTIHRVPHFVPSYGHINAIRRLLIEGTFMLSGLLRLAALKLRRHTFDVSIAVCPSLFAAFITGCNRLISGTPWVLHVQDFQVDAAMRLKLMKAKRLGTLMLKLEAALLKAAQKVSSITPAMCQRSIEKGVPAKRVCLVPNWSDLSAIYPSPRDNAFRQRLGIAADETLVMYAGAMGAKQGLELVLNAAQRLEKPQKIRFVMMGEGHEWVRLSKLAREMGLSRMTFLPLQPLSELNAMLAAADIHLVVQKREAADIVMPSKLTNILAAGRPAIATADPGTALHDAISVSEAGLIVEPENVDALATAIDQLAADHDLRQTMGLRARDYADQYLDQNQIMARFGTDLTRLARLVPRRLSAKPKLPITDSRAPKPRSEANELEYPRGA